MLIFNLIRNRKGQALVETALVLPIILIVLMGIVQFGIIANAYLVVTNASREGARRATVGGSNTEIIEIIHQSSAILDETAMNITITPTETNRARGAKVTVTINYDIEIIVPLMGAIIPNPFQVNSTTIMRVE